MSKRARNGVAFLGLVTLAAACATATDVRISRSDAHVDAQEESTTTTTTTTTTTAPTEPPAPIGPAPPPNPVTWGPCGEQPAPWQCATLAVPMDYRDPTGKLIFIALTRLPATDPVHRIGSLIVNPGGPGGSGLDLAYTEAEFLPGLIAQRFDLVGFDPRGVGHSTAARCPDGHDPRFSAYDDCIEQTGDLLKFLGTPNVARDLDQIRAAVGDERLTYLGYSYGTALGGVYADLFPGRIRALVLDGAVDPKAGRVNTTGESGDNYYAQQDFDRTIEVYHSYCDATIKCAASPHSKELLDRVEDTVGRLPTEYFSSIGRVTRGDVEDLVVNSMYNASYWPVLSVALKDADNGDASTLAAMYSWLQFGYPADFDVDPNAEFAHLAILCADFADRGIDSYECDAFPKTADPLPEIVAIDAPEPIVVIGTTDDPATPARYASLMSQALGDAVWVEWKGAGHTAFLSNNPCIDLKVTDYLVDLKVPENASVCEFFANATTLSERADALFTAPSLQVIKALADVQVGAGDSQQVAECVARHLADRGDGRLIVHELLGVESPDLIAVRSMIERGCATGG